MSRTNLVLTYASGEEFFDKPDFWVYANSLSVIKNSNFVVLTDNMPPEAELRLENLNVAVKKIPKVHFLFRDRHKAYWDFLNRHGAGYEHILVTDSRDVLFQKDPFDCVEIWKDRMNRIDNTRSWFDHFVTLTTEGFPISQSGFATIDNFKFEQSVPDLFHINTRSYQVINGGVALGTRQAMMAYHFLIWAVMCRIAAPCTDQAAINHLMAYLEDDETYNVSYPQDFFCLTGESVKEGVVTPISDGNFLKNPDGETYHIIHQWDRIDSLRNVLAQSSS